MIVQLEFWAIFVLLRVCLVVSVDRPTIGIVAQEFLPQEQAHYAPATSYIEAAYVKAVEASGALVVPIFIGKNRSYYETLLQSINGVVIPGGWAPIRRGHGYYDAVTVVYELAKELNDKQIFFPILGVCLGFEAFVTLTNDHKDPQTVCNVVDEYYPLIFARHYRQSLMYARMPKDVYAALKFTDTTANYHIWCTTPKNFTKAHLNGQWTVLTFNYNSRGLKFISSIEHKNYPFLAVQFHPERYLSEWNSDRSAPFTRQAIVANRYFYDLIVDLAKMNKNKFANETELYGALINNYVPTFWYQSTPFDQAYTFS